MLESWYETTTFTYDEYNKLTQVQHPGNITETLTYNANGQLTQSTKTGGGTTETTRYYWNDQGFLTKVLLPSGKPVEYKYDGVGRLTGRKDADGEQIFVQSGWSIMTEQDTEGRRTFYTGSSSQSNNGGEANFFLFNHRGDTVLITDQTGTITNNLHYEAYGKATDNTGTPIPSSTPLPPLFVGAYGIRYDRKTELSYMRFRWYSESFIRFICFDKLLYSNRYSYTYSNPVNLIDFTGLEPWYDKIPYWYISVFYYNSDGALVEDAVKVNHLGTNGRTSKQSEDRAKSQIAGRNKNGKNVLYSDWHRSGELQNCHQKTMAEAALGKNSAIDSAFVAKILYSPFYFRELTPGDIIQIGDVVAWSDHFELNGNAYVGHTASFIQNQSGNLSGYDLLTSETDGDGIFNAVTRFSGLAYGAYDMNFKIFRPIAPLKFVNPTLGKIKYVYPTIRQMDCRSNTPIFTGTIGGVAGVIFGGTK